jgi:hypothetical protein
MSDRLDALRALLARHAPVPDDAKARHTLTQPGDPDRWQTYQSLPMRYVVTMREERIA